MSWAHSEPNSFPMSKLGAQGMNCLAPMGYFILHRSAFYYNLFEKQANYQYIFCCCVFHSSKEVFWKADCDRALYCTRIHHQVVDFNIS